MPSTAPLTHLGRASNTRRSPSGSPTTRRRSICWSPPRNAPSLSSPAPPCPTAISDCSLQTMLPDIQTYREIARSLPVRAMWHAGEGRPKEAWQDLLAVHRLANLCAGNTWSNISSPSRSATSLANTHARSSATPSYRADDARQIFRDLIFAPSPSARWQIRRPRRATLLAG